MYPILLEIGPITIHTYGLMTALGYLSAILLAARFAPRFQLTRETVIDAAFYVIVFAVLGGRLFYVAVNYRYYLQEPLEIIMVHHGGLVYLGGFIVAALGIYAWLRWKGIDHRDYGDLMVPFVAVGHAVGRIGCFLNGCCYGPETSLPWGVVFPTLGDGVARLPAQLISAGANLLLAGFLLALWRRRSFKGQVAWSYFMAYSALRFGLEIIRGDERGQVPLLGLSTSQLLAVAGFAVGLYLYRLDRGRAKLRKRRTVPGE